MSDKEIIDKLIEIFNTLKNTNIKDLDLNSNIITDLGLDSVGLVYMSVMIEQIFNIDMGDVTFDTFKKVSDVVKFIKGKL